MSLLRRSWAAGAAAVGLCVASAATAGPWSLAPGESYSEISGGYFFTYSRYDADGNRVPIGGQWEQRSFTTYSEVGWTRHASLQLRLPFQSVTARLDGAHPASTSTGLGDADLGLRWALWKGASAGALQLTWSTPLGANRNLFPGFGDPSLAMDHADRYGYRAGRDTLADFGGGRQALELGLTAGWPVGRRAFLELGGGYRYDFLKFGARTDDGAGTSDDDWADHVTADAVLGTWWGGNLQVAGLYHGELNAGTGRRILDANGLPSAEKLETTTHLAGVRVTYRVDDRMDVFAGSWHNPAGTNTLHADRFYCGVAWKQTKLNRLQGFLGGNQRP